MINMMATKTPRNGKTKLGECTEFQLHKSQQTAFAGIMNKILDYSEYKLIKYIDTVKDAQQKLVLVALLHDYIAGHVAIAWKKGQPVWIKVSKA
jgi:hypothetical protein